MLKLCGCFRGNKNDRKKDKQTKKRDDVKLHDKRYTDFGLLLTGDDESGKTKIIEELVASKNPFTLRERVLKTAEIERYIRDSLTAILHAFQQCNPPAQLEHSDNQHCINYILTTAQQSDFDYPVQFFELVEILWDDAGLRAFLVQSDKYRLPHSAKHFLNRVSKIRDPNYIPSTEDMIHSRLFPSQIFKMSFELDKERVCFNLLEMDILRQQQYSIKSLSNTTKAIVFITDCSAFNLITDEKRGQTQLHQSLDMYKTIRNNKNLQKIPIILLFNKYNLLEDKIKTGIRLEEYFPDFANYRISDVDTNVKTDEDPEVMRAKHFIQDQFVKDDLNCYHHFTTDSDINVQLIVKDSCDIYKLMAVCDF